MRPVPNSTYQSMKPADAAREMQLLPDNVLVPMAQAMNARKFAAILAKMSPPIATALTAKLNPNTTIAFELPK
jgi:flagellar motility protein MotE (MotC chaperone)